MWHPAQNVGRSVNGIAVPTKATTPITRIGHRAALDFQFMLPASKGKLLDQESGNTGHIIEVEHRHRKIDGLVGDYREKTVGRVSNFMELITNDDDLWIPFAFPPFGDNEIVGGIQETITHFLYLQLFGNIGKQRETPLRDHHNTTGTGTFMTPTILPFRIKIKPMAGMFDGRHPVSGFDHFGDETFDQGGFTAVRPTDKRNNWNGHGMFGHRSIVIGHGKKT